MNILYICESDPDGCANGSEQRTHLLYEALCELGDVKVLCVKDDPTGFGKGRDDSRFRPMSTFKRAIDFVCRLFQWSIAELCPKLCPFPAEPDLAKTFPGVTFDRVVIRYLHLAGKVAVWTCAPAYVDVDDHPLQLQETVAGAGRGRIRRALARMLVRRNVDFILERCVGGWISNPDQIGWFRAPEKIKVLRNIPMDVPAGYGPDAERVPALMTVGQMGYAPNARGVEAFLKTVWPEVRRHHPDLEYWIVGAGVPEDRRRRWASVPGVKILGFVEDLHGLYAKVLAAVVPIEQGGGTCIKTMEALAHSRACLTTPFGARGFDAAILEDGANGLLVYRTAEEFLDRLGRVTDGAVRARIERNARIFAEGNFSREAFRRSVREILV